MIFSKVNYDANSNSMSDKSQNSNIQFMKMGFNTRGGVIPVSSIGVRAIPVVEPDPQTIVVKKMKWGEPTWFLFHTLAEKIKDTEFPIFRRDFLNIILSIASNLPCPDCANHAKEYLNKINFNAIQTKIQFKECMFQFHNMVNAKKGMPLFKREELDAKYSMANLKPVINNFIKYYTNSGGSFHMISDEFYRKQIVQNMVQWIESHISSFA